MKSRARIELAAALLVAALLVVAIPLLHRQGFITDVTLYQWAKYLCYGLLAISVDLLWGFTGLLSLGQALFFSLGGYMLGMNLMLMIGKDSQYFKAGNNPNMVPDFMIILGRTTLPEFWKPFASFPAALAFVVLIPALLALVFGFFAFRSRIKGVYFSILTQALTYGAALMFFTNGLTMGGNNGFTDFKKILGYDIRVPSTQRALFVATALLLTAVYFGCRWLTKTKFGLVQRAIRDSETRVLFSGYAAANYKLLVFVVSSVIASLGGALFVAQVGAINPSEMNTQKSLEAVVWCAVGGRGTLVGPIIGAVGINGLKTWATRQYPALWPIFLGTLFILCVLFLPKGIVGIPAQIRELLARRRTQAEPLSPEPHHLREEPMTDEPAAVVASFSEK